VTSIYISSDHAQGETDYPTYLQSHGHIDNPRNRPGGHFNCSSNVGYVTHIAGNQVDLTPLGAELLDKIKYFWILSSCSRQEEQFTCAIFGHPSGDCSTKTTEPANK
jgi:hypothetical protein